MSAQRKWRKKDRERGSKRRRRRVYNQSQLLHSFCVHGNYEQNFENEWNSGFTRTHQRTNCSATLLQRATCGCTGVFSDTHTLTHTQTQRLGPNRSKLNLHMPERLEALGWSEVKLRTTRKKRECSRGPKRHARISRHVSKQIQVQPVETTSTCKPVRSLIGSLLIWKLRFRVVGVVLRSVTRHDENMNFNTTAPNRSVLSLFILFVIYSLCLFIDRH